MKNLQNILLTGVGAPGAPGTLYALRNLGVSIIGTDADPQAVGKYMCDAFYILPWAKEEDAYLAALHSLCAQCHIDVIVPQNTAELLLLATHKEDFEAIGTRILVSNKESIEHANNKYYLLNIARSLGIQTVDYALCSDFKSLEQQVLRRQGKGQMTVIKPPCGNGSRGVRIIINTANHDRKYDFFHQKPSSLYCTLEELHTILGESFPELLVMDYLEGDEYTVDVLRTNDTFLALPRKREVMRSGITFRASLERNETILEVSRQLAEALNLQYCFGFQFKNDNNGIPQLLECNPRVQGTMVLSMFAGANIIAESVRALMGESVRPMCIDWNTRIERYWGAIGINDSGIVKI